MENSDKATEVLGHVREACRQGRCVLGNEDSRALEEALTRAEKEAAGHKLAVAIEQGTVKALAERKKALEKEAAELKRAARDAGAEIAQGWIREIAATLEAAGVPKQLVVTDHVKLAVETWQKALAELKSQLDGACSANKDVLCENGMLEAHLKDQDVEIAGLKLQLEHALAAHKSCHDDLMRITAAEVERTQALDIARAQAAEFRGMVEEGLARAWGPSKWTDDARQLLMTADVGAGFLKEMERLIAEVEGARAALEEAGAEDPGQGKDGEPRLVTHVKRLAAEKDSFKEQMLSTAAKVAEALAKIGQIEAAYNDLRDKHQQAGRALIDAWGVIEKERGAEPATIGLQLHEVISEILSRRKLDSQALAECQQAKNRAEVQLDVYLKKYGVLYGVLEVDHVTPEQVENLKRQFQASIGKVTHVWRGDPIGATVESFDLKLAETPNFVTVAGEALRAFYAGLSKDSGAVRRQAYSALRRLADKWYVEYREQDDFTTAALRPQDGGSGLHLGTTKRAPDDKPDRKEARFVALQRAVVAYASSLPGEA